MTSVINSRKEWTALELAQKQPTESVVFSHLIGQRPGADPQSTTLYFYETVFPEDGLYITLTTQNGNRPIAYQTREMLGEAEFRAGQLSYGRVKEDMYLTIHHFKRKANGVFNITMSVYQIGELYPTLKSVLLTPVNNFTFHRDGIRQLPKTFQAVAEQAWRQLTWFKPPSSEYDLILRPKYCMVPKLIHATGVFIRTPEGTSRTVNGQTFIITNSSEDGLYRFCYHDNRRTDSTVPVRGLKLQTLTHTELSRLIKRTGAFYQGELRLVALNNGFSVKGVYKQGEMRIAYKCGVQTRYVILDETEIQTMIKLPG